MREEDIDRILKDKFNNDIKAPRSLKDRISYEIGKIDGSKNKKKKVVLRVMQSVAAMAVVSILGLTTYATVTKNPILEKLGLIKGSTTYEENAKDINEDLSNEYAKITLSKMALDNAYIIMQYNININESGILKFGKIETDEFLGYNISIINTIKINNKEIDNAFNTIEYANKISDTEYCLYQIIQIADIEDNNLKIEIAEKCLLIGSNQTQINKEILIEAERDVNTKKFNKVQKEFDDKIITVENFQNTSFETFVKVSIDILKITEEDIKLLYSEKNPNNISFTVLDDNNNYVSNICYRKKAFVEDEFGRKLDILNEYNTNNISFDNAKTHLEYIITLGDIDKEINKLKIIPYISVLLDEREDNYEDYYNNLKWHKLQSGEYIQKSTLGGEIKITKLQADDQKIVFGYELKGCIVGIEEKVLLRINDDRLGFNVINPTNTYIKNINAEENISEFYRNGKNVGIFSDKFKNEEDYKLNDISKIEFSLLAEPTIKLLDDGLELKILEDNQSNFNINKIEVRKIENVNENISNIEMKNMINEIADLQNEDNIINTNSIISDNIADINYTSIFGKDDNNVGNVKLGMEPSEIKEILGEPLNIIDNQNSEYENDLLFEYDEGMKIAFIEENGKYRVYYIDICGQKSIGPRGIKIGNTKKEVIDKFYHDQDITDIGVFTELYHFDGNEYYGGIRNNQGLKEIEYFGDGMMLRIYLDENEIVNEFFLMEVVDF